MDRHPIRRGLDAGTCAPTEGVAWRLFDARAEALTVIDRSGKILLLNETAARQFGKPVVALLGASLWESWSPDRAGHHRTVLNEALSTGRAVAFVEENGGLWQEYLFLPLPSQEGMGEIALLHIRDVSRLVSAEEALKRAVLRQATVEEDERRRISQDLHDDIGQRMTALMLELNAASEAIARGDETAASHAANATRTLEGVMKQIRQISFQLHPPSLDGMPLTDVLAGFCASFAQSTGLRVEFSAQEDLPRIGQVGATACYRFVQEGLANAVRHAEASLVWISVDCGDESISISLEDNGRGFDPSSYTSGLGLAGIRERILGLNGSFDIDSAPGKGARLTASLPLASVRL
jgi:PAS domain S-box-containing protein